MNGGMYMKQPLAFRMRPQHLDDIIGQQHLIGEGKVLRRCVLEKRLFSMIFYGPPGTGKTTLAMVLANELELPFRMFNAVTGNKKDLDTIFQEAIRCMPSIPPSVPAVICLKSSRRSRRISNRL